MKKKYSSPRAKAFTIQPQTIMIAGSSPIGGITDQFSVKRYRNYDEDDEWDDEEIGSGIW